jgi:hypothetical protein
MRKSPHGAVIARTRGLWSRGKVGASRQSKCWGLQPPEGAFGKQAQQFVGWLNQTPDKTHLSEIALENLSQWCADDFELMYCFDHPVD